MSRSRARRFLLPVLVMAVLVGIVGPGVVVTPEPAPAAVHNLFAADQYGFPKDWFYAAEALFVTLTSDTRGGTVCVVPADVTDPTTMDCAEPVWGDARPYLGLGTLLGYPFFGGSRHMLRPGDWRLMATATPPPVGGDLVAQAKVRMGKTDPPPKGTELSEVFTVVSCTPLCETSYADAQLAPWKAMASRAVPNAAKETVVFALDLADRMKGVADAFYGGIGFGMGWGLMAAGWSAMNFDPMPKTSAAIAHKLHKSLADGVRQMWQGIANDPPDPNFETVAQPVFTPVDEVTADATVTAGHSTTERSPAGPAGGRRRTPTATRTATCSTRPRAFRCPRRSATPPIGAS